MSPRKECASLVQTIRVWLCVDDQLFNTIGVTPSAGLRLFARWCDICWEQRARVLFGTTTTKSHGVPTSGPSPSTVPRERLRHAIGSRVTLHCQGTAVPCCDSQPWLFHRGFAGKPNKCEGILYPSLASSVTPIALSSRSPSLCVATVESTEF